MTKRLAAATSFGEKRASPMTRGTGSGEQRVMSAAPWARTIVGDELLRPRTLNNSEFADELRRR
jgi:hypothetical protein